MFWGTKLRESKIFFAWVDTPGYFESAKIFCQKEIAKDLKKPFRVLVAKGIEIPSDYFEGIEDIKIKYYDPDKDNIEETIGKLLGISIRKQRVSKR